MIKSIKRIQSILLISIPFLLLLFLILFTQSSRYLYFSETISTYVIIDLLFSIPLVYFLVIRKTKIPNVTVVPMVILGLIIGYYTLPIEQYYYLDLFKKFVLPIIEITVFIVVFLKVRFAIKTYKANQQEGVDFYDVLQDICCEIVPGKMSSFLASEISVIYYGFLNWKKPKLTEENFTYHKKSGTPALFGALIFIVFVETIAVHIVLIQWSHLAALILSILSVYTGIQLLGFSRSLSKRPITIVNNTLILRYGILNETAIKIEDIESIELSRKPLMYDDNIRKFSILGGIESHNVVIKCKSDQQMKGIYGITRVYSTLALHIDEKDRFKMFIEETQKKLI